MSVALILSLALSALPAHARFYDVYRADYQKGAPCVAVGAACVSMPDEEMSFFQNPAALMAGDEDKRALLYDGDYSPGDSSTLEVGQPKSDDVTQEKFMAGVGWPGEHWGGAVAIFGNVMTLKTKTHAVDLTGQPTPDFNMKYRNYSLQANVPFAFAPTARFTWGFGVSFLYYHEFMVIDDAPKSSTTNLDKVPYPGLRAGFLYKASPFVRFGMYGQTSTVYYVHQEIHIIANAQPIDYVEDIGLVNPWILGNGVSLMPWGDSRTIFMDLDLIGDTRDGFQRTVDIFSSTLSDKYLRSKGRGVVVEPHLGYRSPLWHGSHWNGSAGYYFENSRWEGLPGRHHGTAGLAYKLPEHLPFILGGMEFIAALDVSRDYLDFELTFR